MNQKIIKWQHGSKALIFLMLLFNSFTTIAQSKYTIIGYGEQLKNGDILYLTYKVNDKSKLDSTVAYNKRFAFSGVVKSPVKAGLYRNENPMTSEFVNESLAIYIEPGTIKINSPDTLRGASVGGTPLNETMELYRIKLAPLTQKSRSIKDPDWFNDTEKRILHW